IYSSAPKQYPLTVAFAVTSSLSTSFAAPGMLPLPKLGALCEIPLAASFSVRNIVVGAPPYLKISEQAASAEIDQPISRNFLPPAGVQIESGVPAVIAVAVMSLKTLGVRGRS